MKTLMLAGALILSYSTVYADSISVNPTSSGTPSTPTAPSNTTQTPSSSNATSPSNAATQNVPADLGCQSHFPATTLIPATTVQAWSEKAIVQTFDYNSDNLDIKLQALKVCFTDTGWVGFTTALDQSGNLSSIRTQKLAVSAQVDGASTVEQLKENQWRVTLPLEVVYQNKQDKVTQLLTVSATVARKVSGDLGIVQIIASPRKDSPKQ